MKKPSKKPDKKKKKFVKPIIITKVISDSITSVYGTYGYPNNQFGGT